MSLITPPVISGLPVIGNMVEFLRDKIKVIERGYQQHGEIFAFRLANQNVAMLLGPENSKIFFDKTDKELSIKESSSFLEPILGQVGILGGFDRYQEERKIVAPLLGGRYMQQHIQAMVIETQDWMQTMGNSGEFDINDFSQTITMYVAARALLGDNFREQLGEEFIHLFHILAEGVDQILPNNLPLPRFRRRDKAKKRLDELLGALVDERRTNPDKYDDFLQKIVDAEINETGEQFDKERLTGIILLLIFAGFDTTSAHLAWGLVFSLKNSELLTRIMSEVETVFAQTDTLELKHLRDLPHLNYTMMEVERHRPAVQVLARMVKEDITIGDYHIPEGWMVMISPEVSHHMERVFSQPEQFDPMRFNNERCEHASHPNTLTGFGGGMHKCWGMKFAYNEMVVIIAMLLQRYNLTLTEQPVPEKFKAGMIRPVTRIQYQSR